MRMQTLLLIWEWLSGFDWWVYPAWYLCGIWAVGAMLNQQLWELTGYDDSIAGPAFWLLALGGGLILFLAFLGGSLQGDVTIPGPWARKKAATIAENYADYCEMLKKDRNLPQKYGPQPWYVIWGLER